MDNFITGNPDNVAHLVGHERFQLVRHDVSNYVYVAGDLDYILHFASPASPIDYLQLPIQTLKVGALGTHNLLGLAKNKGARLLLASTSEVYGDPLIHPQQEEYWGNVNPVGTPRRLRRGQALRRGDHDGLPPLPRRRDADRPHLQHVRPAHARRGRPRGEQLHQPGHPRRGHHGLRRRLADALVPVRRRPRRRHLPPAALGRGLPGQHRQPRRDDDPRVRRRDPRAHGLVVHGHLRAAPGRRPEDPPARHHEGARDPRVGAARGPVRRPEADAGVLSAGRPRPGRRSRSRRERSIGGGAS